MRVGIVGAGGVGLGLASALGSLAEPLVVLGRERDAAELADGAVRTGLLGEARCPPEQLRVTTRAADLAASRPDVVVVCTKATALAALLQELSESLPEPPCLVLCQNGWGAAQLAAQHLPAERVFNARVITGFRPAGAGRVVVTAHADAIRVGSLFGADLAMITPLCDALRAGGLPCEPEPDIEPVLFAKLLYNALLNPLGALLRVPYGALAEGRGSRAIMQEAAREAFAILDAAGARTPWPDAEAFLADFYGRLLPPTREHESSMLQDLRAGRPTEIDFLNGALVAMASEHDVAAPLHTALVTLTRAAEAARPVTRR